jgi:hypothetical protein
MAGTLVIGTLSDGTNSTSATNAITGSSKAWVNYNGVATTIRASYNVSSVTRNGTGDYTVNFTNAFVDANYVTVATGCDALGGAGGQIKVATTGGYNGTLLTYSTTAVRLGNSGADFTYMGVACYR